MSKDKVEVPMGLRLLGFTEEDMMFIRQIKDRMGSIGDVEAELTALKAQLNDTVLRVAIMNQLLFRLYPKDYEEAARQVDEMMRRT